MQLHIANIEMTRHLKFQYLSAAALRFGVPSFIQSHLDSSSSLTRTNICDIENADMLYVSSGRSGAERPPSRSGHGMAWQCRLKYLADCSPMDLSPWPFYPPQNNTVYHPRDPRHLM